jgi:class 3 adenylate cyclase/CheY-like chemotaxis protein
MNLDSPAATRSPNDLPSASVPFSLRVAKARHDLHNAIGQILGFSEMWLEEAQEQRLEGLQPCLQKICRAAGEISARIHEDLDATRIEAGRSDLPGLQSHLCFLARQILEATEALIRVPDQHGEGVFRADLARIAEATRRVDELARTSVPDLIAPAASAGFAPASPSPALLELLPALSQPQPDAQGHKDGSILVVDDEEANRELLRRRLSRLGYSVQVVGAGEAALDAVAARPPDLILLDILMPGLDGFGVLQRLKDNPFTQHIPIIMLSSADELDTAVTCIKLGADDFLPKPFNATLLIARIESSLTKKRLRDQETAFLHRLQTERDISEGLLLNILPGPIAQRLKHGEKNIADSFPEVTVLFSDFVGFTSLAARVAPKFLVARLNEIFSAFDKLCAQHGLEKIKMIGDAYMAVGGLPSPLPNHAEAAADLALEMQSEARRLSAAYEQPLRMRIGINTGPVVAGVIGTNKFAYDLWGDTVNLASRMETRAPAGGILVTGTTYRRLRRSYSFKPGRAVRVKGKGKIVGHLLVGKKGAPP